MRKPPVAQHHWREKLPPEVVAVVTRAATEEGIFPDSLFEGKSSRKILSARGEAMRILRLVHGYRLQEIADCFKIHHSTVLAAVRRKTGKINATLKSSNHVKGSGPLSRSNLREYQR